MADLSSLNVPTRLTLARLIFSPLVLPLLLFYFLPYNSLVINSMLMAVFAVLALTDFFDGYLARRMKQETALGKSLDPIADKFLVVATLIALLAAQKIYFYWVIILIGRELFVMMLRSLALEQSVVVHVSLLGKVKTFAHMVLLAWLILNPYQELGFADAYAWNVGELVLLILSLVLSLLSAWQYYNDYLAGVSKKSLPEDTSNEDSVYELGDRF